MTLGVGELNQKGRASQNFILSLGLDIAHQFRKFFSERDCIKKRKAEKACDAAAKRRREVRRMAQNGGEERLQHPEGGEQFATGRF